ncbi:NUDIX hydrolase domain-like [Phytophthora cactorum]|nr:NUDIX hydrolase domain-like [Phytophthora cactorum]
MDELAAQVLPSDSATKLLRVFCFLRQHDRKARIARKTAELNAWRTPPPAASQRADDGSADEELQQSSPTEVMPDKTDLLTELNLLATSVEPDGPARVASGKNGGTGSRNATAVAARASGSVLTMHELRSEIKELQKGVITSSSDTSGVITAADLSSCLRSLNRVPSKGEVQWMIWEVDDDLDGSVSWEEFKGCYVRTLLDSHGHELNQLYYLIQFLLCDTDSSQTVSGQWSFAFPQHQHVKRSFLVGAAAPAQADAVRVPGRYAWRSACQLQLALNTIFTVLATGDFAKVRSVDSSEPEDRHRDTVQASSGSDNSKQAMSGPLGRIIAQVVVMGAGIVSKAFVQAYQQAVHNARSGNAGAMAAKTVVRKNQMPKQQAREILNFPTSGPAPSSEEIQKQFTSHPLFTEGELEDGVGVKRAAIRKLEHELGIPTSTFAIDDLSYVSTVMYKAASDANWTEYEMDHILFARGDVSLDNVNKNEVEQVEFVARENLPALLNDSTRKLSPWFHLIGSNLLPHWWDNLDAVLEKDNSDRQIHDYR